MSIDCEHDWSFAGLVYHYKDYPRPGSSAVDRIYEDQYYCTKCLKCRYMNAREHGDSYTKPIEGTKPK